MWGHSEIESRRHYLQDVILGEDGSQVRKGVGQPVMALLRNMTLEPVAVEWLHQHRGG